MRRLVLILTLLTATLAAAPSLAQTRSQLGPLCTTDTTPADQQNGIVNIVVAFAPLRPAEFVIIKIAQLAGQTAAA